MGMFESKNEKLYTAKDTLQDVEPSTLTEFGQNVSDNLTVLGNRISSIMSGSSDDSWDDKVKTQITSAIEKIGTSVKEEQKTAEVVKGASSILSTLKSALEEYVLGYDSWETHVSKEPQQKTESYTEEGSTEPKTRYTQAYLDWKKEDAILRKTVPELEEQAETWMEQMKTYFEAYNFEKHEIDTTIYKENKNPLKFYGDLYKQYESEYVPEEEKENVVPAETETPPVEETTELGTTGKKKDTSGSKITDNGDGTYTVIVVDAETGRETKFTIDYDPSTEEGKEKLKEKLKEECGDTFDEETLEQLGDTLGNSSKDEQRTPREVADEVVQQMKDDGCGDNLLSGEGLEELWKRLKDKGLSDEEISQVITDYMKEGHATEEEITQTIESLNERFGTTDETSDTVADEKPSTYKLESGTTVVDNGDGTYVITLIDSDGGTSKTFSIDYDPTTPEGQERLKSTIKAEGSSFIPFGGEETICDEIVTVISETKEDVVAAASDVDAENPQGDETPDLSGQTQGAVAGVPQAVDTSGETIPDCLKFGTAITGNNTIPDTPADYEYILMQNGYSPEEAQAEIAALRENGLIAGPTVVNGQVVSQPETPVEGAVAGVPVVDEEEEWYLYPWDDPANEGRVFTEAEAREAIGVNGSADQIIATLRENGIVDSSHTQTPETTTLTTPVENEVQPVEDQTSVVTTPASPSSQSSTVTNPRTWVDDDEEEIYMFPWNDPKNAGRTYTEEEALSYLGIVSNKEETIEYLRQQGIVEPAVSPTVDTSGDTIPDCLKFGMVATGNNTIPDTPADYEYILMQNGYSPEEAQAEIEALRENGLIVGPTVVNGQVVSQPETPVEGAVAVAPPAVDTNISVQTAVNDVINGMTAEGMGEYILSGEGLELFWDRMAAKGVGVDDISGAVADLMRQDHCTDNEITTTLNSLQTRYERMINDH